MMNGQITAVNSLAEDQEVVEKSRSFRRPAKRLKMRKPTYFLFCGTDIRATVCGSLEIASTDKAPREVFTALQEQLKDVTRE